MSWLLGSTLAVAAASLSGLRVLLPNRLRDLVFFVLGITLLELLVAAIQAYVFALLTSVYLNDAVNLH